MQVNQLLTFVSFFPQLDIYDGKASDEGMLMSEVETYIVGLIYHWKNFWYLHVMRRHSIY